MGAACAPRPFKAAMNLSWRHELVMAGPCVCLTVDTASRQGESRALPPTPRRPIRAPSTRLSVPNFGRKDPHQPVMGCHPVGWHIDQAEPVLWERRSGVGGWEKFVCCQCLEPKWQYGASSGGRAGVKVSPGPRPRAQAESPPPPPPPTTIKRKWWVAGRVGLKFLNLGR